MRLRTRPPLLTYLLTYMDNIMERGTNETMSGKERGRNTSTREALKESMRLSRTIMHPYSKN